MTAMTHSREELMDRLLTLYREGLSCRVIARALGVGYHAVRRQLAAYTRRAPSTRFCSNDFFT